MSLTPRILLVDDDPQLCTLVKRMLEGHGMALESVGRGNAGLAALRESRPDALLLDLDLPDMSGDEVMRRALELHPGLPIVVLTAERDGQHVVACVRAGASDYVIKPCNEVRLITSLHNALEQGRLRNELRSLSDELHGDAGSSVDATENSMLSQLQPERGAAVVQPESKDAIKTLADWERLLIEHALTSTRGNVREAARRLGIGRTTLYRKMERYALEPQRPRRAS